MALTAVVAACSRSPARSVAASPTVMVSSPALTLSPSAGADAGGGDAAVAGARTLVPHEGVLRAWWGDSWEDAAWDLAYTVRPRWYPRHVLLLGIGGGSAAAAFTRDNTGLPRPEVVVVEPDPAIRAQAAALGLAEGAKVAAGEEAIPAGATFDVILVDIQDDRSPQLASLDAAKAARVRQLLTDDGLLLIRRIARPSDPQLAVAARLFGVGFPFQRLVGSRLDGAEQDLLLVLSRKPIDGAFVYNGAPRVELPPPAGGGPERDLAAVRRAAEHDGEVETRVGYVEYHRDQLGIEGPCPEDASPGAGLTGPGARELAPRSSAEGTHYATRLPDDQDTVVALLGMSGSDDCTTRLSPLAAAVQGTKVPETNLLSVSEVLFAVDSAQWKSLRRAVVAPRMMRGRGRHPPRRRCGRRGVSRRGDVRSRGSPRAGRPVDARFRRHPRDARDPPRSVRGRAVTSRLRGDAGAGRRLLCAHDASAARIPRGPGRTSLGRAPRCAQDPGGLRPMCRLAAVRSAPGRG